MGHNHRFVKIAHLRLGRTILPVLLLLPIIGGLIPSAPRLALAQDADSLFDFPTFLADNNTRLITMGDLNGDGKLDLVVNVGYDQTINKYVDRLYFGAGDGSFADPVELPRGGGTSGVALGDLNSDGVLDLVLGSDGGALPSQVYLGEGDGSFAAPIDIPHSSYPSAMTLGDLNSDGMLDLVLIGSSKQVYRGKGDGSFSDPINLPASQLYPNSFVRPPVLADLNGDGALDLVIGIYASPSYAYPSNPSQVYFGKGNGTFADPVGLPGVGSTTNAVAVGDLNGDGVFDLITANSSYFDGYGSRSISSQIYFGKGHGSYTNPVELPGSGGASSVAVSDIDGDGALDLVFGGNTVHSLYLGKGDGTFGARIELQRRGNSYSVVPGDLNGDGALDLVFGDGTVYLGKIKANFAAPTKLPGIQPNGSTYRSAVAFADLNGDDLLDVVAANNASPSFAYPSRPSQIYFGKGDGSFAEPIDLPGLGSQAKALAVGDVNGDGALDLVLGSFDVPIRIYLGKGDGSFAGPKVLPGSQLYDSTSNLVLGDLNGDGALDLVALGSDQPSELYLGNGDGSFAPPSELPGSSPYSGDLVLGDLNGDGVLDLVIGSDFVFGTDDQFNQIYLGKGDGSFVGPAQLPGSNYALLGVALGDLNGDGMLDLVASASNALSKLYFGKGNGSFAAPVDLPGSSLNASKMYIADLNGDGKLDLVCANRIYMGKGDGSFASPTDIPSNMLYLRGMAIGDLNSDGALDLLKISGDYDKPWQSHILLNTLGSNKNLPNTPPSITIARPGSTANADFYSTSTILSDRIIPIHYKLRDKEGDPVGAVRAFYSLNGGGSWQPAIAASGTVTTNLTTSPIGTSHIFNWDTFANGLFGRFDNVVVRLLALPIGKHVGAAPAFSVGTNTMFLPSFHGSRKVTSLLPGPYQRPYIAATTFPFRVRGTQVRVVSAKQPEGEEGALVYRIHAEQPGVALPSVDRPLATDPQGYLLGHGEIDVGDRLVALNPITSTNTYTIYATNATPTATGIDAYTVQNPGVQTLTVSSDHTLALFDLAVSLEWDARSDTQFTAQLVADLKRTSELLYNWTKGQTALGNVTIYHDKQHWQDAQVRVYASNQIRPNANKNGIAITGDQVRIGAVWNRYGEANGTLGEDWPRALAHEFGHYAFGLDDNYLGLDAQNRLIPVESCPGVMSNPYRADQSDFRPRADWLPACEATLSNRENQRSDWATIVENYPWLHDPTTGLADMQPGPSALPLAVTQIRFVTPTTPTTTLAAPIFYLTKAEDQSRYVPTAGARAFLFTCSGGACQGQQPSDLIDLGRPTQDQVVARGAQPGDRLCMYDLNAVDTYGQAAPRQGCLAISQGSTRLDLRVTTNWQPEVHITPETTTSVTVAIGNISSTLTLQAQLDPASGVATAPIGLAYDPASKTYQGTFMLATPSVAGDVHIWVDEPEPRREVVADYGLGGNPARRGGGTFAPVLSPDGQVLLYGKDLNFAQGQFYTLQAATHIPAPPAWATVVGQGYWLSAPAQIDLGGASMNFNYLGRDVPPGEEQWVTVYFCPQSCPADGSGWQPLQTTRALATNTAVALVQGSGPGLYTLMSSIEIPLTAGVNYFAYAIQESRPVRQALLSIDSTPTSGRAYTLVRGYDTANQRWLVFDPAKPDNDPANTLKTLQFGQGYEITVNRNVTLRLKGSGLSPGSGASATQAAPALYYGMLAPGALILTHTTEPVLARIDDHICGKGVAWADGQVVRYLITVSADAPSAAGCGAPGRTVTIQLGTHTWTTVWDNKQAHSEQDTKL